jgi:hypothetical protein
MAKKINKNKKGEVDKNRLSNLIYSITFLLIAVIITTFQVVTSLQDKKFKEEISDSVAKKVEETIKKETSSEYPDYSSLGNLKRLNIITNFTSWTPNSKLEEDKTKIIIVVDKGHLSKGYVYIKASLDNNPLTRSESVYLKMNNVGGHLVKSKSFPVPNSSVTELLFPLDSVFFYSRLPYTEGSLQLTANYLFMFVPNSRIRIDTFISSLKPAVIQDVSIFYDCVTDEDCSLSLLEQK